MFKKLICISIALILTCLCPLMASADMGAPYFEEITYTIDNFNGIDAYSYDWDMDSSQPIITFYCTIPFGTTITITGEAVFGDTEYGYIYYRNEPLYVKLADIQMGSNIVKPKEEYKLDSTQTVVVINPDGVGLHAGPSFAYDKLATVPYGTELEYQYTSETWAYVTYNGTTAWIYCYQYEKPYNVATVLDKSEKLMVVDSSTYLTKTPDTKSETVTGALPKGTVLSYKYYFQYPKSRCAFVEYNGTKGWIITKDSFAEGTASESDGYVAITNPNGVKLYSEAKTSGEVIGTVPSDILLPIDYEMWNDYGDGSEPFIYLYVSYNGVKGWIRSYQNDTATTYGFFNEYTIDASSLPVYSSTNVNSDVVSYLSAGETVTVLIHTTFFDDYSNESWALIYKDNCYGWVYENGSVMTYKNEAKNFKIPNSPITIGKKISADLLEEEVVTEPSTEDSTAPGIIGNESTGKGKALSPLTILLICIGGASVLFITAIVLIIVIVKVSKNKKKKNQAAQQMNAPVNPAMNQPVNPAMNRPVNPAMNRPVNPAMNRPVNPAMNQPVNPTMNQPVNPAMNQPVNPAMNQPVNPTMNQPENNPTDNLN